MEQEKRANGGNEGMDVRHVALLARLALTDEDAELFRGQMADIVGFVRKIGELNIEGIEPTTHAHRVENVFREDEPAPGLDRATALANAPEQAQGLFLTPRIVE